MSAATATILSLVGTAAAVGGSVYGATKTAGANQHAADLQKSSTDAALAYEKERDLYARTTEANRYGTMMDQNAPYVASGHSANTRMQDLLGLPPQQAPARGVATMQPTAMPAAGGAMVTMRAPDGSTQQVPAAQVAHYESRGAQRV